MTKGGQWGRGGMGSHKHGTSGRSGPPKEVKRATAAFFNKASPRRRRPKMCGSVREAIEESKGK